MKRFVIATASALFLFAGTAMAAVPPGPVARTQHLNPIAGSAYSDPGVMPEAPVGLAPLAPEIDPGVLGDPDLAIPGVPGGVSQLFGAVDPALAAVTGALPPLAGLVPPQAGVLPPGVSGRPRAPA
jgi:hypothetical protein